MEDLKNELKKGCTDGQDVAIDCLKALSVETHDYDKFNQLVLQRLPKVQKDFKQYGYPDSILNGDTIKYQRYDKTIELTVLVVCIYATWAIRKKLVNTQYTAQDTKALLIKKSPIIDETNTYVKKILNNLPSGKPVTEKELSDGITQIDTNTNEGINTIIKKIENLNTELNEIKELINTKSNLIDHDVLNTQKIIINQLNHDTGQIINGN